MSAPVARHPGELRWETRLLTVVTATLVVFGIANAYGALSLQTTSSSGATFALKQVIGALVGLVVGALLVAWSSGGLGLVFDPPWLSIALAVCFGILISITASIYPAGLASRLSIVRALQHE